jgi:FkbM family methyltransferase
MQQISIDPATALVSMREPGAEYDFRIEKVANDAVALRLHELYVSADADGIVRNDRNVCREWEEYRLVPTTDERPSLRADISRETMPLPDVSLIDGKTGRFLMFHASGGNPAPCPAEPVAITLAARVLSEVAPGTIVDAGAGSGAFAIPIGRRFTRNFTVLCFEVQRIIFYQLCGNVVANSLGNVFPHNVGLSDATGSAAIPICNYKKNPTDTRVSIDPAIRRRQALAGLSIATAYELDCFASVAITTLDSFGITDVRLVKLDVEGLEFKVLRGAQETIIASGYPPILFASSEDQVLPLGESCRADLLAELDRLGYELTTFGRAQLAQHRDSKKIDIALLV